MWYSLIVVREGIFFSKSFGDSTQFWSRKVILTWFDCEIVNHASRECQAYGSTPGDGASARKRSSLWFRIHGFRLLVFISFSLLQTVMFCACLFYSNLI
mmetsp:Transcript_24140/g.49389  ORF Transcript_24140/g.49389 Transcript_24140/m.49389 type:complete len:99 (-) Transcript_24140:812-1108(-)